MQNHLVVMGTAPANAVTGRGSMAFLPMASREKRTPVGGWEGGRLAKAEADPGQAGWRRARPANRLALWLKKPGQKLRNEGLPVAQKQDGEPGAHPGRKGKLGREQHNSWIRQVRNKPEKPTAQCSRYQECPVMVASITLRNRCTIPPSNARDSSTPPVVKEPTLSSIPLPSQKRVPMFSRRWHRLR